MQVFAGWVPTITGQLSFSLVGLRSATLNCISANAEHQPGSNPPHRSLVTIVRRVARDVPRPIRWFQPARIKHCIVVGTTQRAMRPAIDASSITVHPDELGGLRGSVYVVPYHRNRAKNARAKALVKDVSAKIAAFRKGSSIVALKSDVERRVSSEPALGLLIVDYILLRTGEVRILAEPNVSADLCDQVYYLLKDLAHRHYHHSSSDDNLLPLSPVLPGDDQSWRRNTLWCLARIVLEARRRDRIDGYKNAVGMLAYAEVFQGLLGRVHRIGVGPALFSFVTDTPNYDFTHTRSSLEAKIAEHEYKDSARAQSLALWVSTAIATIALWISAVQIATPICDALKVYDNACSAPLPHLTAHSIKFLIEKPFETYGIIFMLVLLYLGRRVLSFMPVAFYEYGVIGWSQAVGASVSRATGANDRIGQIAVILSALAIGTTLFVGIGTATGVFDFPGIVPELLRSVWPK